MFPHWAVSRQSIEFVFLDFHAIIPFPAFWIESQLTMP